MNTYYFTENSLGQIKVSRKKPADPATLKVRAYNALDAWYRAKCFMDIIHRNGLAVFIGDKRVERKEDICPKEGA